MYGDSREISPGPLVCTAAPWRAPGSPRTPRHTPDHHHYDHHHDHYYHNNHHHYHLSALLPQAGPGHVGAGWLVALLGGRHIVTALGGTKYNILTS